MSTVATKALQKKVDNLAREVATLRSLVIQMVRERDPEGEYRAKFVKEVLKAMKEPAPYTFTSGKEFLKLLRRRVPSPSTPNPAA